jgi:hypothetical protein
VSAPAPALAKPQRPTVIVRLADAAVAVATLSLIFGLLLVFFPVAFPRIIVTSWQRGYLAMVLMVLTLVLDAFLYLRASYLRSAKPTVLVAACLGSFANRRRRRTQLSYGKCRRSDNFPGPAESASSYQRGSTRSYLLGIGLRCFSALPRDPASATVQGNKLGTQQLNPSLQLF